MIKTLVKMESCLIMPKMWTTSAIDSQSITSNQNVPIDEI